MRKDVLLVQSTQSVKVWGPNLTECERPGFEPGEQSQPGPTLTTRIIVPALKPFWKQKYQEMGELHLLPSNNAQTIQQSTTWRHLNVEEGVQKP